MDSEPGFRPPVLILRRGFYHAGLAVATLVFIVSLTVTVVGGAPAAPLPGLIGAIAFANAVGCLRTLRRARSFRLAECGVICAGARGEEILAYAEGLFLRGLGGRGRPLVVGTRTRHRQLPRYLAGDRAGFTAALCSAIQRTLTAVYDAGDAAMTRRQIALPPALAQLRDRCQSTPHGGPVLVFAAAPATGQRLPIALAWFGAALVAQMALALASHGSAPGREPGEGPAIVMLVLGMSALLIALLIRWLSQQGKRWLLLHDHGLALIMPALSGELAWSEVAAIEGVRSGLTARRRAAEGDRAAMVRIRTLDQAQIVLFDSFDAPLSCIVAAIRERIDRPGESAVTAPALIPDGPPEPSGG